MCYALWGALMLFCAALDIAFAFNPPGGDAPWLYAAVGLFSAAASVHAFISYMRRI